MNWGKGITIAMILFMGFILFMVVGFFSHSVDLDSEDYYQQEIAYGDEITSLNNANELTNKPAVSLSETHLILQFSAENDFENIQLVLKRPNNKNDDQLYKINNTKTFTVDRKSLKTGAYEVELSYDLNGKTCLQKEEIYI